MTGMKKPYGIILFLLVMTHGYVQCQGWQADLGNGYYQNPILHADYSDPDWRDKQNIKDCSCLMAPGYIFTRDSTADRARGPSSLKAHDYGIAY